MNKPRILVTGGAGFIGSHLVDSIMLEGSQVCVLDNLSAGNLANLNQWHSNSGFSFVNIDLTKPMDTLSGEQFDVIYHLAANPEVRVSSTNPETHYHQNITATFNLLEYIRKSRTTPRLVFTSTSAVYGEPTEIPTPETYGPLKPISVYAATKLACEALISAYAYNYGFKATIYRLANVIGPRSGHGVIYDFIQKLHNTPNQLEILGDGSQTKSYLHVTDCITALLQNQETSREQVEIFNVGSEDKINVKTIAEEVVAAMGLTNVDLKLTGGVDGGRGWVGDVKIMLLNAHKIKLNGWTPKLNSHQAVTQTARALTQNNPQ
jgi:UDP-glucose 4-epimerase